MVLTLAPAPVIDAHDPQGVGAAGYRPGALFQDAQDRVVTHRHAEAAQETFAGEAAERVADQVDDVTQAMRAAGMPPQTPASRPVNTWVSHAPTDIASGSHAGAA